MNRQDVLECWGSPGACCMYKAMKPTLKTSLFSLSVCPVCQFPHIRNIVLFVPHQETREPLPKEEVAVIWENCKDYGLLIGTGEM